MRKLLFTLIVTLNISAVKAGNINAEIVELAKIYRNFMFRNSPVESTFKQLDNIETEELSGSVLFIEEAITTGNSLTTKKFLTPPDEGTLLNLYIIRRVNWNLREKSPKDNVEVIKKLQSKELTRYILLDSYYDMLFSGVANKNQPFDLSTTNFELFDYELTDETEKGIFFLKAMDFCGTTIWGYMNIVNPPNYKKALEYIKKYPKFNGRPYFQYLDFGFSDFELQIEKDKDEESFKAYYINKYYDTLLSHMACLSQKKKQKQAKEDLALGSILKEKNYYEYSKKKKALESIFKTMER